MIYPFEHWLLIGDLMLRAISIRDHEKGMVFAEKIDELGNRIELERRTMTAQAVGPPDPGNALTSTTVMLAHEKDFYDLMAELKDCLSEMIDPPPHMEEEL